MIFFHPNFLQICQFHFDTLKKLFNHKVSFPVWQLNYFIHVYIYKYELVWHIIILVHHYNKMDNFMHDSS